VPDPGVPDSIGEVGCGDGLWHHVYHPARLTVRYDCVTITGTLRDASSHELCEAITDPIPGQGWYDDTNGEIGDICAWQTKKVGDYTVQLEWSNQANQCL
jgi:hypothetical protein